MKKVFRKVVSVAKKVLPIALAVGAVVFTGGAALGVLPSFGAVAGGLVAKLGLSTALSGALTGAITSAGFGGALGFVTGGKKGLRKGALMGALTGGALGLANPSMFGIVKGVDGATTTMNALKHGNNAFGAGKATTEVVKNANGTFGMAGKAAAPASVNPVTPTVSARPVDPLSPHVGPKVDPLAPLPDAAPRGMASTPLSIGGEAPLSVGGVDPNIGSNLPTFDGATGMAPAAAKTGGMLGAINKINPMLAGQLLQGVGGALSGGGEGDWEERYGAMEDAERRRSEFLYGGIDKGNPFGVPSSGGGGSFQPRYFFDREKNRVVDRAQGGY